MFPVIDVRGDVVAFGGRVLDKSEPKYVNTQETIVYSKRRNLYGINLAKKTKRPQHHPLRGQHRRHHPPPGGL